MQIQKGFYARMAQGTIPTRRVNVRMEGCIHGIVGDIAKSVGVQGRTLSSKNLQNAKSFVDFLAMKVRTEVVLCWIEKTKIRPLRSKKIEGEMVIEKLFEGGRCLFKRLACEDKMRKS